MSKCPTCGEDLRADAASGQWLCNHCEAGRTLSRVENRQESAVDALTQGFRTESLGVQVGRDYDDWRKLLAAPQGADEVGRLGPYRILRQIGAGGMGAVFEAEDPQLKRRVAIKIILPAHHADEIPRQRFLREARLAAAFQHDHVVPVFQVGEDKGILYLVMPFLEGESLDSRLKRDSPLSVEEAVRIARELCEGLAAAHERGLIHRDVKPANVWLEGERQRVKILDFGLARSQDDDTMLSTAGSILGTPAFMAPEQAAGHPTDERSDLFSVGGVLYLMLTGRPPFAGRNVMAILHALANDTPAPPGKLRHDLPPDLSELVESLLAKNPDDRPKSASAVVEALGRIQSGQGLAVARPTSARGRPSYEARIATSPPRSQRTRTLWLAGSGAVALIACVCVALAFSGRQQTVRPSTTQEVDPPVASSPVYAVLTRAMEAQGGAARLARCRFVHWRGSIDECLADQFVPLEAFDELLAPPDRAQSMREVGRVSKRLILNSGKAWFAMRTAPAVEEFREVDPALPQENATLAWMVTLFHGDTSRLEPMLMPSTSEAQCVQVSYRGAKDVRLFFDANTGRLKSFEYTAREFLPATVKEPAPFRERFKSVVLAEWKSFDGVELPTEMLVWLDGAKARRIRITACDFPDKLADETFTPGKVVPPEPPMPMTRMGIAFPACWAWSPDGKQLLFDAQGSLRLLNLARGITEKLGDHKGARAVMYSTDGQLAASADKDGGLSVWDVAQRKRIAQVSQDPTLNCMVFMSDAKRLISAGFLGATLWDIATEKSLETCNLPSPPGALVYDSERGRAAFVLDSQRVVTWKPGDKEVSLVDNPKQTGIPTCLSTDGRVVSISETKLAVWEIDGGKVVARFDGHSAPVTSVCLSRDGRRALSCDKESSLHLWDVSTGNPVRSFTLRSMDLKGLPLLSPDGRFVLAMCGEQLLVWDMDFEKK